VISPLNYLIIFYKDQIREILKEARDLIYKGKKWKGREVGLSIIYLI